MIKLTQPFIPPEAIEKCVEVLKSGNLVQGKYVHEFEQAISEYLGVKHTIVVSSGTAALHLSLIALGIGPGDEVIVPAFSFPATANVVEITGAKVVFVDITLEDFCINTSLIESAITNKTKAIMPVHEFGQSADMNAILKIADQYKLFIIEDAACALGTEFDKRKAGTMGKIGCFSFHPRKAITTGEGGAIVTNDDNIAEELRTLRNHGIVSISGKLDFRHAGFNYRMTDFQAMLGIIQLEKLEEIILHRIDQANRYSSLLREIKWIKTPVTFPNRRMVYQSYHILIDKKISTLYLKKNLLDLDIEVNIGAYAIPVLSYYKSKYHLMESTIPNAIIAYRQGLVFPMGKHINNTTIDFIVGEIGEFNS